MKKFFYHFNRVNMQRGNANVWTVHWNKTCYQVERIVCEVPVESVFKPEKRQPRAFFVGKGNVKIKGNTAVITNKP